MLEKIQRTSQTIKACGSSGQKTYPLGTPFDFIRKDYEGASAPSSPAVKENPYLSQEYKDKFDENGKLREKPVEPVVIDEVVETGENVQDAETTEQDKPVAFVVYRGGRSKRWDVRCGPKKSDAIVPGGEGFTENTLAETFASEFRS